ncbi:hypothetical protein [Micromonospora sp.]|uniref:hypothetical protein n=1 Tax=Micromonospora sp. TaxID=1876 RepID=UPI003B3A866D
MSSDIRSPWQHVRDLANRPAAQPQHRPAEQVDGGYGRVPAAAVAVDTTADVPAPPTPRPLTSREADRLMQAELLGACRQLTTTTTDLAARLGGRRGAVNGVLLVRLVVLDASGRWSYAGPVAIGSALVDNHHESDPVYVASGQSSGPGPGLGVQLVAAGQQRRVPVADHAVTLWGTAGAQISVQLFTGLQAYGVGL